MKQPFKHITAIAFAATLSAFVSGCASTPIKNAYDLRDKASKDIGRSTGVLTPWPQIAPLTVARIYERVDGGFKPYSPVLLVRPHPYVSTLYPQTTWSYVVSGNKNLKLQLSYLECEGAIDYKSTRKVNFSAASDEYVYVEDWPALLDTINAKPDIMPGIRSEIISDTRRLAGRPSSEARFWICTEAITAKDVGVTIDGSFALSPSATLVASEGVKKLLATKQLPNASVSGEIGKTTNASFASKAPIGFTATLYPLLAKTNGDDRGYIYADKYNTKQ